MPSYCSTLVQFKEEATGDNKFGVYLGFASLLHECHHPSDNRPYISSIQIGSSTDVNEAMAGFTYLFTLQFTSPSDRAWYVNGDPVARSFKRKIEHLIDKIEMVEFESEFDGMLLDCMGNTRVPVLAPPSPPDEDSCFDIEESEIAVGSQITSRI
ncbi:hypothetical protein QBC38DRAFT_457826 [Podospora fimiseda]|uniref:Stress-response A/B barrel domain-containing protein n=1 Tax=Podospora fimiseda TaxID=252190 RepID=A0AAN7BK97_9PEZI|nr:hypothetical protein QBC38DRAFT_457826 [Podospora fimiseda]